MEDSYDNKNGYDDADFKRHAQDESFNQDQDGGGAANPKLNQKCDEYLRQLLSEKIKIDEVKFPFVSKLLDQGKYSFKRYILFRFFAKTLMKSPALIT